jgi:energy-coupling factor transporter ATP-binding protein EcfA2
MTAKIVFENVGKTFHARGRTVTALQDINLDVRDGEFLVIVGPSGCGKSTLLDLLGGLSDISSGRILVDGSRSPVPAWTAASSSSSTRCCRGAPPRATSNSVSRLRAPAAGSAPRRPANTSTWSAWPASTTAIRTNSRAA